MPPTHRLLSTALALSLGAGGAVRATTDQQRVARFAALFNSATTHKYARIVWQREHYGTRKPNFDLVHGQGSDILAMDTKDGKIRVIKAGWPSGSQETHLSGASLTWDGKKIIYYDNLHLTVRVCDWDGGGDTVLLSNYEGEGRTWQGPDGKNWVLATEFKGTATGAKLYRVNIDNPAEKVEIFTCPWPRVGYAGSTCWAGMSVDGAYVVGGFPNYGDLALLTTSSKATTPLHPNGCWPSISRDNQYHILYTDDGNNSHRELYLADKDGKVLLQKVLKGTPVFASGDPTEEFESLRNTGDPDYVSFFSAPYDGAYFNEKGTANPKIVRLSDLSWAAINDSIAASEGNCDVWFYTDNGASGLRPYQARPGIGPRSRESAVDRYDVRGRTVGGELAPGARFSAPKEKAKP